MVSFSLVRRLDLTSLLLFVAICDEGTLTRAAEREHIAASALSKRLNELEHTLQSNLFVRHSKGMTLTPAGNTLLRYAGSMLQSVAALGAELGEYANGIQGQVRVLANMSAIVEFLPDDLRSFFTNHATVKVVLDERVSIDVVRGVKDSLGDIGICVSSVDSGELLTRPYRRDRLILAVPRRHPLARYDRVSFEESLSYEHIGFHADSAILTCSREAAAKLGKEIKQRIQAPGFDAICRMVASGLGVALMPDRAYEALANKNAIKAIDLSDSWVERELKIVMRDEVSLTPAGRLLVDYLGRSEPADRAAATH